ncbi:MAG TPA: thioredoxin [Candidatus Nitrosopelagicus sp.]|jgi:thioredoxin 1|nr:thioredoxin [Candidatus Nitrosopelagicus sp.]|tara:strand:+ start:4611 stop:5018 length:408 start_codon:yes stop_codon:yes gene_type:complete
MVDEELERLKKKQLEEVLKLQNQSILSEKISVIDLDINNFEQIVSKDALTLVDFWAEWCGPCKSMHPIFTRLAKKYHNVKFGRVNVDNNQNIAMKFGVQSIPTFIMFRNGKPIDKMIGAVGEPGIHMICKKHSLN